MRNERQIGSALALALTLTLGGVACDAGEAKDTGSAIASGSGKDAEAKTAPDEGEEGQPGVAAGELFGADMREKPCALLTAEMAAQVLGVEAGKLEPLSVAKGMCSYDGGDAGEVSIISITVKETIEQATTHFANAYKGMTPEETAAAMKQLQAATQDELAKRAEAGDAKAAELQGKAEPVVGAMGGAFKAGFAYEDVAGIGDVARLALTKREIAGRSYQDNELHVRVRNMYFTVTVSKGDPAEHHREELMALGKQVTAAL